MKNILLSIALLLAISVKSQTSVYHPFPEGNVFWNVDQSAYCFMQSSAHLSYSVVMNADTTINLTVYHQLFVPFIDTSQATCRYGGSRYVGSVRQDTTLKMVYIIPPNDSIEVVLYDFNLAVGDTVPGYIERFAIPTDTVVAIDSALVGGSYHKRWLICPSYNIYIIEGLGSTFGVVEASPGSGAVDFDYYNIMCFNQDGQSLYPNWTTQCNLIDATNEISKTTSAISIFPNPMNTECEIVFESNSHSNGNTFQLINTLGDILLEKTFEGSGFRVERNKLPAGLYHLVVSNSSDGIIRQKLIIQ